MQATMIKLEMNAKMEKAIARCKANHPKVRRVDASTVKVVGKGAVYTVRFCEPKAGLKLASCDCKAGIGGQLCYHVPAALVAPVAAVVVPLVEAVTTAAPAVATVPTMAAQSACSLVERIEQSYGGLRFKAFYCDGWPV